MVFMPQITFLSSAIFFGSYRVKNHLFNKQQLTYVLHNSVVINSSNRSQEEKDLRKPKKGKLVLTLLDMRVLLIKG